MLRGTRILMGAQAAAYASTLELLRQTCLAQGFQEIVLPNIWETETWTARTGAEIEGQMWSFQDKGGRNVTLVPEATAMVQQMYREKWSKELPKPIRLFYVQRAYRYERPQEGRYREFTQFGLEILGPKPEDYTLEARSTLLACLQAAGVESTQDWEAVRGLSYYTRKGFESRCPELGAQQQIAGGGTYAEGCGWAIGVDRLLLALEKQRAAMGMELASA